jgi:hypothetical protein
VKLAAWTSGLFLELNGDPPCSKADQSPLNLSPNALASLLPPSR